MIKGKIKPKRGNILKGKYFISIILIILLLISFNCAFADSNRTFTYEVPVIGLDVLYPTNLSELFNATQNEFFNVTLNVSCVNGNCGSVNVSLDPVDASDVPRGYNLINDSQNIGVFESITATSQYAQAGYEIYRINENIAGFTGWLSANSVTTNQNITVTFTDSYDFDTIEVWGYGTASPNNSRIWVSDDGVIYTNVTDYKSLFGSVPNNGIVDITTIPLQTKKYFRIEFKDTWGGTSWMSVPELRVYRNGINLNNLTTTTKTATSQWSPTWNVNKTGNNNFDGNDNAWWAGDFQVTNTNITWDFGCAKKTDSMEIYGYDSTVNAMIANYTILVSDDGSSWTEVANGTAPNLDYIPVYIINWTEENKQYLRLWIKDAYNSEYIILSEIRIWEVEEVKGGLINITAGATPFYTNASSNPLTTSSLSSGQSELITFWVNATGETDITHTFFAYANLTSNLSISNITSEWDVEIIIPQAGDTTNPDVNLTYPLNTTYYNQDITELNYTYSDENPGYCWYSNDSGVNNYSIQSAGLNFTGFASVIGSNDWNVYCNDSSGNENSSLVSFYRTQTSISSIYYEDPITLTGGTTKDIYIKFNISDVNFNSSSGQINISHNGESRYNLTCLNTTIQFNCTLSMQYYDSAGVWTINTSVKNNNQEWIYNDTESFTLNDLDYITQDNSAIQWGTLNVGSDDNEADNTITLTNRGNQNYSYINITGYYATGETYSDFIFAENFSISNLTGQSSEQIYIINETEVDTSLQLNLNNYGSSVTEEIFFYVDVPTGLLADTYKSDYDWGIQVS